MVDGWMVGGHRRYGWWTRVGGGGRVIGYLSEWEDREGTGRDFMGKWI